MHCTFNVRCILAFVRIFYPSDLRVARITAWDVQCKRCTRRSRAGIASQNALAMTRGGGWPRRGGLSSGCRREERSVRRSDLQVMRLLRAGIASQKTLAMTRWEGRSRVRCTSNVRCTWFFARNVPFFVSSRGAFCATKRSPAGAFKDGTFFDMPGGDCLAKNVLLRKNKQ